jgi:hypothetical protein
MKSRIVVCLIATIFTSSLTFAADFPKHIDICAGGIVSKEKLAKAILKQNADWLKLYVDANDGPNSDPKYKPQWRRIFTDPKFCIGDPGCEGAPVTKPDQSANKSDRKPKTDNSAALKLLDRIRFEFASSIQANADGRYYSIANQDIGTDYLLGGDSVNPIRCIGPEIPTTPKPTVLKLPIRLRANSDDLGIDAARDKDLFKSVKPATVTFTRDGVKKTDTAKLQAALGYAIPLPIDIEKSKTFSFFTGEFVPYFFANQSVTKIDGKAATFADTNIVAVGTLLNTQMVFNAMPAVNHVVMAKPQYLWNTKDNSEIASLKLIYQPWTLNINTPIQLGSFLNASWLTLLFDLRDDVGEYTKKGNDPTTVATHTSFNRAGSKFGFAVSTDDSGPHLVLSVTDTILYGFSGSLQQLRLFDSSLSYYFDSTSNFAFTVSYTNGRNEDTAEQAQTFTGGISAKF